MNKVTTINLNGTAYQLEEVGYERLKKYLATAKKNLADDPDKDEVLADFERAIAEKCNEMLTASKNVITEKEMDTIIDDMGPVESADGAKSDKSDKDEGSQPKRLYTLRDGAIVGGVANGVAAYFNLDVTVVRLIFVILTFITSGAMILIYLVMMVIVPEARTQEEKAELRGERFSAQEVLNRAKQKYADVSSKEHWHSVANASQPALSSAGEALKKILRVLSLVACAFCGIFLAAVTSLWLSGLWWLTFGHINLYDQLSTIPMWMLVMAVTAAYFFVALPLAVLTGSFGRFGTKRPFGKQTVRGLAIAASLWVVSFGVLIGVAAVTGGRVSSFQASHAYIDFGQHQVCINSNLCGENDGMYQPKPFRPSFEIPALPPQQVQPQ